MNNCKTCKYMTDTNTNVRNSCNISKTLVESLPKIKIFKVHH